MNTKFLAMLFIVVTFMVTMNTARAESYAVTFETANVADTIKQGKALCTLHDVDGKKIKTVHATVNGDSIEIHTQRETFNQTTLVKCD